jgi:hypothetical protein
MGALAILEVLLTAVLPAAEQMLTDPAKRDRADAVLGTVTSALALFQRYGQGELTEQQVADRLAIVRDNVADAMAELELAFDAGGGGA